jgi:5'-nucleotidase
VPAGAPDPEVIWCLLDRKPLPLNYRHEEETGLYFAGDSNLLGPTPKADADVCFNDNIAVSQVKLLEQEGVRLQDSQCDRNHSIKVLDCAARGLN